MLQRFLSFVLVLSALTLAGCNDDPTPARDTTRNVAESQFKVVKAGAPIEVDGCSVQVHRVYTSGHSRVSNFTLATAKCPTAQVTATSEPCGKSCVSETVQVTADSPSTAPAEKLEESRRLAEAQALANSELRKAQAGLEAAQRRVLELNKGNAP